MQAVYDNPSLMKGLDKGEMGHSVPCADHTRGEIM